MRIIAPLLSAFFLFGSSMDSYADDKFDWRGLGTDLHNYRSCNFSGLYAEFGEAFKAISNSKFDERLIFIKGYDDFRLSNQSCDRTEIMNFRKDLKQAFTLLGLENLKYQHKFNSTELMQKTEQLKADPSEVLYNRIAKMVFQVDGKAHESLTAFRELEEQSGFTAKGVFLFESNICNWWSQVTDEKSKKGDFTAQCEKSITIEGNYFFGTTGGSGSGIDSLGRPISFSLTYF